MVGGVLAERTVKDIKPQIEDNMGKIGKLVEQVNSTLEKKLEIRKDFKKKYSIEDPSASKKAAEPANKASGGGQGAGVLVWRQNRSTNSLVYVAFVLVTACLIHSVLGLGNGYSNEFEC